MHNALLLLPDFALILLGALLRRWLLTSSGFWNGIEQMMYYVLFPALIVSVLTKTPIDFAATGPVLLVALAALVAGMVIALAARPIFALEPMAYASRFQCAFRYNTYIGIAVAGKLHGEPGVALMGIICGVMIPFMNFAAVWTLARHGSLNLWRELARNPLILATIVGLTLNITGVQPPAPVQQFLGRLAEATVAIGLLTVGAALRWRRSVQGLGSEIYFLATKLIAVPFIAWWVGRWAGLQGMYYGVVVAFAALPPASAAYILTVRMGGDGPGVAWLISAGTLLAMITLTFWISLNF